MSNNRFELISRKNWLFPEKTFLNSNYQGSLPKGMITSSSNFKLGLKTFGINTKNGQSEEMTGLKAHVSFLFQSELYLKIYKTMQHEFK